MGEDTLIALAGLLVSGIISILALWFAFRERRVAYRQALYTKQLDIYVDMLSHIERVYQPAMEGLELWLIADPQEEDYKKYPDLLERAREQYLVLLETDGTWAALLPEVISSKGAAFRKAAKEVINPSDPDSFDGWTEHDRLGETYREVVDAIRQEIAIEPLSQETRDRIAHISGKGRKPAALTNA